MNEVTHILSAIEQGDSHAAEQLLPLVYEELRKLAAQKLAQESPGQTLQATSLIHEAYLRLVDTATVQQWNSRGHFFAAAAEAMRRILVENARRKRSQKGGGDRDLLCQSVRQEFDGNGPANRYTQPTARSGNDLIAQHDPATPKSGWRRPSVHPRGSASGHGRSRWSR